MHLRALWLRLAAILVTIVGVTLAVMIFMEPRGCVADPVPQCKPLQQSFYWVTGVVVVLVAILLGSDTVIKRRGQ